ncbi:helix-turn-helix domain-containing protein [Alphaproteobacteria bacterium]|nr:helix-turn-helix domain-containing protein [Alphaproteobacteria bacterium]
MANTNYSLRNAINLFTDKYKIEILFHLLKSNKGFNQLKTDIEQINQQILSKQLKQLLKDGLIDKDQIKGFPKRPIYTITKFGKTLKPVINSIIKWENLNKKQINKIKKRNNRDSLYDYY